MSRQRRCADHRQKQQQSIAGKVIQRLGASKRHAGKAKHQERSAAAPESPSALNTAKPITAAKSRYPCPAARGRCSSTRSKKEFFQHQKRRKKRVPTAQNSRLRRASPVSSHTIRDIEQLPGAVLSGCRPRECIHSPGTRNQGRCASAAKTPWRCGRSADN